MAKYQGDVFQVNRVDRPLPSEMSVAVQKLSKPGAGRAEDGIMHTLFFRKVRSISFGWSMCSPEVAQELANALDPDSLDYFTVTYNDPEGGGLQTRTFYSGDMTFKVYSWSTRFKRYDSITVNIIER